MNAEHLPRVRLAPAAPDRAGRDDRPPAQRTHCTLQTVQSECRLRLDPRSSSSMPACVHGCTLAAPTSGQLATPPTALSLL